MKLVVIIAFLASCAKGEEANSATLELVHVFFRHGSRTPDKHEIYANDPHAINDFYPIGYGQLTNEGKQRAHQLGKVLQKRYKNFLGPIYTPEIVYTQTTDFDRTKMSALLVLASLFPPSESQKWDNNLNWMPIPYHYHQAAHDFELRRPNGYCRTYMRELNRVLTSDAAKKFLKEQTSTLQYISEHIGQRVQSLHDVFRIFQVLHSEETMNLTLPSWTKSVYPDVIRYLAAQQCYFENYTPILKRLNGGRMLNKVVKNMIQQSEGILSPAGRKIFLYSAHDNNVVNILATLNLYEPHFPDYSAAVLVELYRNSSTTETFVKVVYVRDVYSDPEELKLANCDAFCPLSQFIGTVKPFLPANYTRECDSSVLLD